MKAGSDLVVGRRRTEGGALSPLDRKATLGAVVPSSALAPALTPVRVRARVLAFAFALATFGATAARSAGPIGLSTSGVPLRWKSPVRYQVDQGNLGGITNADASSMVDSSFAVWTGLASVNLQTTRTGSLSADVVASNATSFLSRQDGITPIVYDTDGTVIDQLLGTGARQSILGFASPEFVNEQTGEILEGSAVLNGFLLTGRSSTAVMNVMVHEFGHMLGLAHAQLNGSFITDGKADNNRFIPVMYPFLRNTADNLDLAPTPTLDDEASLGFLYPSSTFYAAGNVAGGVTRDGATFRGANVVVRNLADPLATAVSWPSGIASLNVGAWEAHLLPAGQYSAQIETIDPEFTGGSNVGNFDPPPTGIAADFYNAPRESSDPLTDDPAEVTQLAVSAGVTLTGIDVAVNAAAVALEAVAGQGGSVTRTGTVFSTGEALPPWQFTLAVTASTQTVSFSVTPELGKVVDVFVRAGQSVATGGSPGTFVADFTGVGSGTAKTVLITRSTRPPLTAGTYFVALVNRSASPAAFTFKAGSQAPAAAPGSQAGPSGGGGGGGACSLSARARAIPAAPLAPVVPLAVPLILLSWAKAAVRRRWSTAHGR